MSIYTGRAITPEEAKFKIMAKLHISYNAPFTITFCLIATALFFINDATRVNEADAGILRDFILLQPPFSMGNIFDYIALVGHPLGHASTTHLIGNLSFILLLGPVVEKRFGSLNLLIMVAFTAIATGLLYCLIWSNPMWGASGIVFMLITLSAMQGAKAGEIPLTFILIVALFIGKEVYNSFDNNQISEFAHIMGGIIGSLFGFWGPIAKKGKESPPAQATTPAAPSGNSEIADIMKDVPGYGDNEPLP